MASVYLRGNVWWGKYPVFNGDKWKWQPISTRIRVCDGENPESRRCPSRLRAKEYIDGRERRERDKRDSLERGLIDECELDAIELGATPVEQAVGVFLKTISSRRQQKETGGVLNALINGSRIKTASAFGKRLIIAHAREFLDVAIAAGRTREWIKKQRGHVARFGQWLEDEGYIVNNFARKVRAVGGTCDRVQEHRAFVPAEGELLTEDQQNLFTLASAAQPVPEIRRLLYRLCLWSGLRGEEAVHLVRGDLELPDAESAVLHVRKEISKNNLDCYLPMAPSLAQELIKRFRMAHPTTRLFGAQFDRRETRLDYLKLDLAAVGIASNNINWRSFRMTFVSWMEAAGVELGARMKLRRDRGRGSERLTNWTYSDWKIVTPVLRQALVQTERWCVQERARSAVARSGVGA